VDCKYGNKSKVSSRQSAVHSRISLRLCVLVANKIQLAMAVFSRQLAVVFLCAFVS